jgi:hypothetical protein
MCELRHWHTIYYQVFYSYDSIMSQLQVPTRSGLLTFFSQHDPDPDISISDILTLFPQTLLNIIFACPSRSS